MKFKVVDEVIRNELRSSCEPNVKMEMFVNSRCSFNKRGLHDTSVSTHSEKQLTRNLKKTI